MENKLIQAKKVLNLSEKVFRGKFGFQNDLLTDDKEKINDILEELLSVLDLYNNDFRNIKKLPKNFKKNDKQFKLADFKAEYNDECFAIEVKTTRIEPWARNGGSLSGPKGSREPSWYKNMFYINCVKKIEEKKQKVLEQLENACKFFNCTKKLLVFNNKKLGIKMLMERPEYIDVARKILQKYPQIHHLGMKDFSINENIMLFYPDLNTV